MASKPRSVMAQKSRYPFYAVARGLFPDVYLTWSECYFNTHGVPGNKYKGFHSFEKAKDFVNKHYKVCRRGMSSRALSSKVTHKPPSLHPAHHTNAKIMTSTIKQLIYVQKFLESTVYLTIKGSRLVTREVVSLLVQTIGDGINYGEWKGLERLCAQLVPPVVESILHGLASLSRSGPDFTLRQDSLSWPTRQDDAGPIDVGPIDEACEGAGLPNGNGWSGLRCG